MKHIPNDWTIKQNTLKVLLSKENTFDSGIKLLLEMHGLLHDKKVYKGHSDTVYDKLWEDLNETTCRIISKQETSIAWDLWHITRIEDIVGNILINNGDTIFNNDIQAKLNIKIKNTGNSMSHDEIAEFNNTINIKELKNYRMLVGKSTKSILESLGFIDMKRKVEKKQLDKIRENGGVINDRHLVEIEHKSTEWLLDFWGKKNILGLIMMPITRHQTLHLNDCFEIKEKYQ